ncbi:MAG TPA: hypothetical protein VMW42_10655 [Desulfatiglandales bacterium]|nr:hypothetical protein [Desulfatiglandales bacterium]
MIASSVCFRQMISSIQVEHPVWYFFCIIIFTVVIRSILCIFRAWAIVNGELDNEDQGIKWKGEKYWPMFRSSFNSNKRDVTIDDYWLPSVVGFFELIVYPILMSQGKWLFIGAWIGVKTASSWGGWQRYRTAYNRFLLGNILSLGFSMVIIWLLL